MEGLWESEEPQDLGGDMVPQEAYLMHILDPLVLLVSRMCKRVGSTKVGPRIAPLVVVSSASRLASCQV